MKVAIVTGASSGLGREFVREIKRKNLADFFYLIARREDRLNALKEELDGNAITIPADLTTEEGLEKVKAVLFENKPEVSFLVNASGYGKFGTWEEVSDKDVKGMIDLNVTALVRMTNTVLPYMKKGAKILQVASSSAFTALPAFNVYASTKAFVLHYTKALRYEIKSKGISATAFCPCWIETEFVSVAEQDSAVTMPKKIKPLLNAEKVVRKAVRSAIKGKPLCVTNWYAKMQHVMEKILPYQISSKIWLKMLNKKIK